MSTGTSSPSEAGLLRRQLEIPYKIPYQATYTHIPFRLNSTLYDTCTRAMGHASIAKMFSKERQQQSSRGGGETLPAERREERRNWALSVSLIVHQVEDDNWGGHKMLNEWMLRYCWSPSRYISQFSIQNISMTNLITYKGKWPQIYTVLNFGMTIFNFHFLLLFLANLTSNWVIFDEKMERQA